MPKVSILLSGAWDLGPIGRHGLSFLSTLIQNNENTIYIDRDYTDTNAILLIKNFLGENYEKVKFSDSMDNNFVYDFSLYFHVLGVAINDEWYKAAHNKKSHIKICYPVFDATVPPVEWIEKINKNFDLCLTPSRYVAHNFRRYGVTIDCFGLECVVLIDDFINIKKFSSNKIFRFGCVSGFEARKNIPFLARSFSKAFTKKDNVELFIHSVDRKNLLTDYGEFKKVIYDLQKTCNIILHDQFVSHQEMMEIWSSFDAYAIAQRSTGYYTTPLEAMACGIPVILSDIPVHRELEQHVISDNNLFFVPHKILVPEYHFVFDYRNIGVAFDGYEEDYAFQFKYVYENRDILCTKYLKEQRKRCALQFTSNGLAILHNFIFHPKNIVESQYPRLSKDGVFFMSHRLKEKYASLYKAFSQDKILDDYLCASYPEEKFSDFKAIELCALSSQNIYLKMQIHTKNEQHNVSVKQVENGIMASKWHKKLIQKAKKYNINRVPRFIYGIFYLYCKIKKFFHFRHYIL